MKKNILISFFVIAIAATIPLSPLRAEEVVDQDQASGGHEEPVDASTFDDEGFSDEDFGSDDVTPVDKEAAASESSVENGAEKPEPVVAEPAEPAPAPDAATSNDSELEGLVDDKTPAPALQEEAPAETQTEYTGTHTPDEPDLNYEAYLHDIFLNYYNAKTSDEQWQALAGSRASERYKIQQGDNLWSISKTLFGDGNYWPKVWSLNADIRNPHIISTNNSIRFLLGTESEPPAFTVTENSTESEGKGAMAKAEVPEATTVRPEADAEAISDVEPEIPPPLKQSRPVVKKLPPSLPAWQDASIFDNYDDAGISYVRRKILDVEDTVQLPSYIVEQPPAPLGEVKEIEVGHSIASALQYIYVYMKPGAEVGRTYLAVANRGEVQSVHPSIKGFLGYSIDVLGEVQLVEKVESNEKKNSDELYRALVLKIVNPVSVGALLIDGKIERVKVTQEGSRSQVVTQIIGGSFFNRRQVFGSESVAYLNRGELDGLREGQILPIRANASIRNEKTIVRTNVRPIGWARVVKTTPHFATIMIVKAWADVLTGDMTGSGDLLPLGLGQSVEEPNTEGATAKGEVEAEFDSDEVVPNEKVVPDDDSSFNESSDFGADESLEDDFK